MIDDVNYTINCIANDEWDPILQLFRDASILQTSAYAAARWPGADLNYLVVKRNDVVVAAAQIVVRSIPVLGGGLAYVHFGPVWRPRGSNSNTKNLEDAVNCLLHEYVDKRGMLLRIKPTLLPGDGDEVAEILIANGLSRQLDASPDRFFVDLKYSPDEHQKGLSSRWRYNLRRAQKHQLEVTHSDGSEGLKAFLTLYREMLSRKSFDDNSAIVDLPEFYASLATNLRPQILLCYYDGEAVAGAIISAIGDSALYLFGATSDSALQLNAGYQLQWSTVSWLREKGCRWYDLGGDSGSQGLRQFKAGMVGRCGQIVPLHGDFERCSNTRSRTAVKIAFGLRGVLKNLKHLLRRTSSR